MSNEIHFSFDSGRTLYFLIRNSAGNVNDEFAEDGSFVAYAAADILKYDHALTENGTNGRHYVGSFNTDIDTAGRYFIEIYLAASGTVADGDPMIGIGRVAWNGQAEGETLHTWHVAKTGNNSNSGVTFLEAKLTISAAASAASAGDKIIIWPGDYVENISIGAKSLIFEGTCRNKCRIVPTVAAVALAGDAGMRLKDLTVISTNHVAVRASFASGMYIVDNCYINGRNDGILIQDADILHVKNSTIISQYDGINTEALTIIEKSQVSSTGEYAAIHPSAITHTGRLFIIDSRLSVARSLADAYDVYALKSVGVTDADVVVRNSQLNAETSGDSTGDAYAVRTSSGVLVSLHNCILQSESIAGDAYDVYTDHADDEVTLANCIYDSAKISGSGTMKYGAIADINGRVDVSNIEGSDATDQINAAADVALNTAIPDSPAANSINERIKAIDDLIQAAGNGDLAAIKKLLRADKVIDTGETPWVVDHKEEDTENVLMSKTMKNTAGENITNADNVLGRLVKE